MTLLGIGLASAQVTPARVCEVLQAAYRDASEAREQVYPTQVAPLPDRMLELSRSSPPYRDHMALGPGEFEDLEASQETAPREPFLPRCAWKGRAVGPGRDIGNRPTTTYFGRPIFSSDRRLALVEVSFRNGFSGSGQLCIMRHAAGTWSGRCIGAYSIR